METLFISKDCKLSREDSTLLVSTEGRKTRIPIKGLTNVVVAGEAGMSTSVLGLLAREHVRVTILDWHGNVVGHFETAAAPRSGRVRLAQAERVLNPQHRLEIAILLTTGAMGQILSTLRYRLYRGKTELERPIREIERHRDLARASATIEALMGHEGIARSWYYEAWKSIDPGLDFGSRRRRPPNNPINCLISWFNGLCYAQCRNAIAQTHLDDCLSFLHSPMEARASLALDLAEIFKPLICDRLIFEIVLRGTKMDSWFVQEECVCRLTEIGRRETLELWAKKLDQRTEQDQLTQRDLFLREALKIERHVLGIDPYIPYKRKD